MGRLTWCEARCFRTSQIPLLCSLQPSQCRQASSLLKQAACCCLDGSRQGRHSHTTLSDLPLHTATPAAPSLQLPAGLFFSLAWALYLTCLCTLPPLPYHPFICLQASFFSLAQAKYSSGDFKHTVFDSVDQASRWWYLLYR